jgi:hypothetical protein
MERTLLICNVPVNWQETDLRNWIERSGYAVNEVRIIRDLVSGTSPSFAHVYLANAVAVDDARRALDGHTLAGRSVRVLAICDYAAQCG